MGNGQRCNKPLRGGVILTYKMKKTETEHILRIICKDYPRRKRLLESTRNQGTSTAILQACYVLNQAVDEAMAETYAQTQAFAPNFGEVMLTDIAECRGFAFSPLSAVMCENSYKKYKRQVKEGIARRLCLPVYPS